MSRTYESLTDTDLQWIATASLSDLRTVLAEVREGRNDDAEYVSAIAHEILRRNKAEALAMAGHESERV